MTERLVNPAVAKFQAKLEASNALQIKFGETYCNSYVHVIAHCGSGFSLDKAVAIKEKKSFDRNGPPFSTDHKEFHSLLGSPCTGLKFEVKPFKYKDHYHSGGDF